MKNARVFFEKTGPARYISHLDLNRVMLRAIAKSGLNIWHTEGFHQHAYITFAQPLSLGFSSCCESMDFRLLNDDEDMAAVPARLNACLPDGLRVLRCAEAVHKPADIVFASYEILIEPMHDGEISPEELYSQLNDFLALPAIMADKKTKKGIKQVDLKQYLLAFSAQQGDPVRLSLTLPAGGSLNINPTLFITALSGTVGVELYADTARTGIYVQGGDSFE